MSTAALAGRVVLATVFLIAGLAKLLDSERSESLIEFGVPRRLAVPAGIALPVVELAVAGALLPRSSAWWGAWGALVLLAVFIAGIASSLARGQTPDCHCFGQIRSAPVGAATLVRNAALAGLAAFVLAQGADGVGASATAWTDQLSAASLAGAIGGLVLALVLATGARLLLSLLRALGQLLWRIDNLEVQLEEQGIALEKRGPEWPLGLPVGTQAPALELESLGGGRVALEGLRAQGRPLLVLFSDPGCGPCKDLLPRIGDWQRDHAGELTVALISSGDLEENAGLSRDHAIANVLLQQDREAARAYGVPGTPGAVVIGPSGDIASPVVMGVAEIEELLASVVEADGQPQQAGDVDGWVPERATRAGDPDRATAGRSGGMTVAVLAGGRSSERDMVSGRSVCAGLRELGHEGLLVEVARDGIWRYNGRAIQLRPGRGLLGADLVFPALHGRFGEDGTVQGLLECLDVPYVGCGVLSSALCLDKIAFKHLMAFNGVPQVDYRAVRASTWRSDRAAVLADLEPLGLPVFIKPARQGSSVGVGKAGDGRELEAALAEAFSHDPVVIVEQIARGVEVECSVLGAAEPEASELGEIVLAGDWYDDEAKYVGGAEMIVPARVPDAVRSRVHSLAIRAFARAGCSGLARADFFVEDGRVLLNELNTMPGVAPMSDYVKLWHATGVSYTLLLDRLCRLALERHAEERAYLF